MTVADTFLNCLKAMDNTLFYCLMLVNLKVAVPAVTASCDTTQRTVLQ